MERHANKRVGRFGAVDRERVQTVRRPRGRAHARDVAGRTGAWRTSAECDPAGVPRAALRRRAVQQVTVPLRSAWPSSLLSSAQYTGLVPFTHASAPATEKPSLL
ncbi:hypothetical protein DC74_1254 [Streptomyces noursei]|uniref:Uncharacterized protein n=1 Tax=Streptomyces noursei TaxID=1971 RepID=A0A059W1J5_STRNR|nr:hypothetical protein DC74_1254 [Streptomyces noursei]GCB89384.1 hypothetical protein SALB_02058 [Streptomyces noursei]